MCRSLDASRGVPGTACRVRVGYGAIQPGFGHSSKAPSADRDYLPVSATSAHPGAERLARALFDRVPDAALEEELTGWLAGSPRFRAFVEAHREKVRKKLRTAADPEARRDVRAEVRVAHLLLADRRIELAFEPFGSAKGGPDFTVTHRGARTFNLEVTRLRGDRGPTAYIRPLLAKLRQLPPSAANVVLFAVEGDGADATAIASTAQALRTRADAKDEAFFAARGYRDAREFYQRFLRLGAAIVWSEDAASDSRADAWINPSARIPISQRALRTCLACLRGT